MSTVVNAILIRTWMINAAAQLEIAVDVLTDLDAARGDGDHGANMVRGFGAVVEEWKLAPPMSAGGALEEAAAVFRRGMGGASGALWASAFRKAGAVLGNSDPASDRSLGDALAAACSVISDIGDAKEGDGTMLDSLLPAVRAFYDCLDRDHDLREALQAATAAARIGAELTAGNLSIRGRSSYVGAAGLGHADPGATSAAIVIDALAEAALSLDA